FALVPVWQYGEAGLEDDPDMPAGLHLDKGAYIAAREEQLAEMRGLDTAEPNSRSRAIGEMQQQEAKVRSARRGEALPVPKWRPTGPAPIPLGQTSGRQDPVSGRATSIAVDPTDPNIVYVGTAGGGLYRTMNGGQTWLPMMDNALSLAIGSVAIA